jgi:hypothetical protein
MLVPFIIVALIAAGLLALLWVGRQKAAELTAERDQTRATLAETEGELASANKRVAEAGNRIEALEGREVELNGEIKQLTERLGESETALRKRTELADAQAMQIDGLSAERDDLQQQLNSAEERIVTLAARPGIVVGEMVAASADGEADSGSADMLWDLEVARSERAWRNSVAINPADDPSPFESTDDPVKTAVEIEAQALREDVGALIDVEWKAEPIDSAARRLLVARVAQEMLALASRAPGAARLVVASGEGDDGALTLEFESAEENQVINLIPPPQMSSELLDISSDEGLSVTVKAD